MIKIKTSKSLFYLVTSVFVVLWIPLTILLLFFGQSDEEWYMLLSVIFLIYIMPILLILFLGKICLFDVVIDEKGIHKIRFKKETFCISWIELKDFKLYNPPCPWIAFSKQSLDGIGLDRARFSKKAIVLIYSKEVGESLFKYCTNKEFLKKVYDNSKKNSIELF